MFSLIRPSTSKFCQLNAYKISVVTNNYFSFGRTLANLSSLPSCSNNNNNSFRQCNYLIHPVRQNVREAHSFKTIFGSHQISDTFTKGMSVFKDVEFKTLSNAPTSTLLFGLGGLIPFVAAPVSFIFFGYNPNIAFYQLLYGGTILAFVGGVKWGYALSHDKPSFKNIGLSTIPSLVAWVGLLVPQSLGFVIISSGLGAAVYVDMLTSNYPPWFRALRCLLTSTAIVSLMTTLLCSI